MAALETDTLHSVQWNMCLDNLIKTRLFLLFLKPVDDDLSEKGAKHPGGSLLAQSIKGDTHSG